MIRRLHIVLFFILSALIIFPLAASAASDPTHQAFAILLVPDSNPATIAKGYFVYQLQAGGSSSGKLQLKNTSADSITVVLEAVDAQTAQTGGSSFSLPGEALTATATWLKLDEASVTLAPDEIHQVGFTLQVPTGSVPRQYLTGISAYVAASPTAGTAGDSKHLGIGVTMQSRQVIGVEADVPGAWQSSMKITDVTLVEQPSGTHLGVVMNNDGATFIKPSGTLIISDSNGKLLATQAITMGTFVPDTAVVYPVALANRPANGNYQISVDLLYDTTKIAHYDNLMTVKDAAPAVAAAVPNGPLQLPSGAQPSTAPASPDKMWLFMTVIGVGVLMLAGLVIFLARTRKRRTA